MSPSPPPLPRLLALVTITMAMLASLAAGQSFYAQSYDELDGLPSSLVYDVDIAPDDRVWFVTRSGIAGFDGVHWEVHRQQTDFTFSVAPHHLAFDSKGDPWFSSITLLHGLGVLRDGKWQQVTPDGAQDFQGDVSDFGFGPGPDGEVLYALLANGTLLRLADNRWQPVAESVRDFQPLVGSLLLATEKGVFELDDKGTQTALPHVPQTPSIAVHRETLASGGTQTWVLTPDGLGLGTASGFQQLHEQTGQFEGLETFQISLQPFIFVFFIFFSFVFFVN